MIVILLFVTEISLTSKKIDLPDYYLHKKEETVKYYNFYAAVAMKLIKIYQQSFSLVQGDVCNFIPSCSHFGYEALSEFGFIKGLLLTSDRLQRCHPFAWHYIDFYGVKEDSVRGERLYDTPKRYR